MKLDPVDQKALKGSHKNAKDKDINNDGKVNSSDEYLHNRRQAVSKAIGKLKEEALEEKKLTAKDVKNALASAKAKPKETVSLKKAPFKMEEVEALDEANQVKMSDLKVGDTVKMQKRFGGKQGLVKAVHKDGADVHVHGAESPTFARHSNFTKINVTKEEAEQIDELSDDKLKDYHAKAAGDLRAKRSKLDQGSLTMNDLKKGQNRVKGLNTAANKMKEEVGLDEAKKAKPGNNAMVMAKNIGKVLAAVKKEETDDTSTIAKHTKPLRMKLAQFRHEE